MELWAGCVAGALEENEYRTLLLKAGFENVSVVPTRIYHAEDAREFLRGAGLDTERVAAQMDGIFMAAFIRGNKPFHTAV